MTFFDKVRVLIFAHQNRVRSIFLEFLYIVVTELVKYVFGFFLGIIGGTPDKRIPEGLFFRGNKKIGYLGGEGLVWWGF